MFTRDIYDKVLSQLKKHNFVFLTGPRGCGKSACLTQIASTISNTKYFDLKNMIDDERFDALELVFNSFHDNEEVTYLLDEITYIPSFDMQIGKIQQAYTKQVALYTIPRTKVVFASSQSVALDYLSSKYFGGMVGKVCVK